MSDSPATTDPDSPAKRAGMRLVIFGRQGAGKGTQCDRIVEKYGVVHLSTGDMFRAARDANTELGQRVAPVMATGGLVNDELTIAIVKERLSAPEVVASGFILDGFPRTPGQAQALLKMLDSPLDSVLNLEVPIEEVTARMKDRAREDDTDEGISKRLALYDQETVPTIEWFDERGLLVTIDGIGTQDEVTNRIVDAIEGAFVGSPAESSTQDCWQQPSDL